MTIVDELTDEDMPEVVHLIRKQIGSMPPFITPHFDKVVSILRDPTHQMTVAQGWFCPRLGEAAQNHRRRPHVGRGCMILHLELLRPLCGVPRSEDVHLDLILTRRPTFPR